MLQLIHIENLAVIKSLDLEPCGGLTVLTGETGAGKSVIIDSINFLLGKRVPRDLMRTGEDRASVSALFSGISAERTRKLSELGVECPEGELLIERTRFADGRTVCRINGRAATRQQLVAAGELLVSLHGQNDTRSLEVAEERTALVDSAAGSAGLLEAYRTLFSAWSERRAELAECRRSEAEKERLRDMLEFQIKDISSARLKDGEEEALLAEKKRLESGEKIRKQTDIALRALHANEKGITASFLAARASDALARITGVLPELEPLRGRLDSCRYELDDIASELIRITAADSGLSEEETDRRLDAIGSRLEQIGRLKRKYGSSVADIMKFLSDAKGRLEEIESADERAAALEKEIASVRTEMDAAAAKLTAARLAAARETSLKVKEILEYLDMPKVSFEISVKPSGSPGRDGYDDVDLMLSANPGDPAKPLAECASGGELSRVMLALKCAIADSDGIPTLIFDEIDTGISGKTSRKIGLKLLEASGSAQILCVTHSAQIASLADLHVRITKREVGGRAETSAEPLSPEERIEETARILGGITVTDAQRRAAEDMINRRD